jgi:hypothetical protein
MTERGPCDHPSATGDEGPNVRHVVRWRCDACDGIHYSDSALANLRAELAAQAEQIAKVRALAEGWRYKGEFGWGAWQEGHGPDHEGWVLDQAASEIRAALDGAE